MKGYLHKNGNVWYTTVELPRLSDGKRRQKEIRLGILPKRDAQAKERDVLREIETSPPMESSNISVEQFLNTWLRHIAPTERAQPIAPKTHERYAAIVRNQLIPHLGNVRLIKLSPGMITEMQSKLREQGLSGRTCLHVHRVLHTALNFAVKTLRLLKANPASDVAAPKASPRKLEVSEGAVAVLLDATKGTRLEVPVQVAVMTGLRRGELLALRWNGVDFERKRLVVSESLEETQQFGLRFKAPKSGKVRVIPLADALVETLKTHKAKQNQERLRLGAAYIDQGLVFCNEDGSTWPPDTLTHQFASFVKLLGMKGFRLHDVRHCFASISLMQGTSVKEVSELLGHSSPLVTLSTYAHVMEGQGREAVNRLADSLLSTQASQLDSVRNGEKLAVAT
ncbi:MAG: tyrosine-type recombinase/integrase [Candidatus Cybelea sp.]